MAVVVVGWSDGLEGGMFYATPPANNDLLFKLIPQRSGSIARLDYYAFDAHGTALIKGIVYSDNAGSPNALLGSSDELSGVVVGLNTMTFSSPVAVTAGTTYWIGVIANHECNALATPYYGDGSAIRANVADTYADGPMDPWTGGTVISSYMRALRAEWDANTADVAKLWGYTTIGPPSDTLTVAKVRAYAVLSTYADPAPDITSVDPDPFPPTISIPLVITGTGFQTGLAVYFNGVAGTVDSVSATEIEVDTPTGLTVGACLVLVVNPDGQSDTYIATVAVSTPEITDVDPDPFRQTPKQTLTITGTGFLPGLTVTLDGLAAVVNSVTGSTSISIDTPAGLDLGPCLVVVTNPDTESDSYWATVEQPPPDILAVAPDPFAGIAPVTLTITGTGFLSGLTVTFNGTAGTVNLVSWTSISVDTPAGLVAGLCTIQVTNPDGQWDVYAATVVTDAAKQPVLMVVMGC